MNLRKPRTLLLTVLLPVLLFAALPTRAQEPQPGDACPEANRFMRVAGPENPGSGHFLFCDSALVWQPVMRFQSAGHVLFNSGGTPAAPLHVWGEAIIGNQSLACSAAAEGALRYTSSSNLWEYCDGVAWTSLAGSGDPSASVQLILPFDGNDGATAATDESGNNFVPSFVGNAQLDTAQKKFGTASLLLDGTDDMVEIGDFAPLEIGSQATSSPQASGWLTPAVRWARVNEGRT